MKYDRWKLYSDTLVYLRRTMLAFPWLKLTNRVLQRTNIRLLTQDRGTP